jgi:hypothetical protein
MSKKDPRLETFNEILKENSEIIADLRAKLNDKLKATLTFGSAELFEEFPELESFSWTQYTPYFNDGDTCEFSANIDYPEIEGIGEANDDYDIVNDAIVNLLSLFKEDELKELFGDHKEVTITRESMKAYDYDHD